ncbi:MAG: flagellar basal body P-ring formation chaperone FlgA [Phenylobacterium sp.]|jgi:flagella basal body P-ring formation protein FlgA
MRRLIAVALSACLALAAAPPAVAGMAVSLKSETVDSDGMVTLGDLFEGAGGVAGVRVAARPGPSVVLDASAVQSLAHRSGLDWGNPDRLRRIIVRAGEAGPAPVTSQAQAPARKGGVQVLAYTRSLSAGEEILPEDLAWTRVAVAPANALRDAEGAIGMIARRPLREGAPVAASDMSAPVVIQAGDLVTVVYENGGVFLSLQVKAMSAGAVGEVISLQNLASRKTLQAVVTGPGEAATGPDAAAGRAPAATRIARR